MKKYRCINKIITCSYRYIKFECVISLIWCVQKDFLISFRMLWMVSMNGSTSSTTQSRQNHQLPMPHPSQRKWRLSTAWSSTTRNWSGGSVGCWPKLRSVPSVVVVGYSVTVINLWTWQYKLVYSKWTFVICSLMPYTVNSIYYASNLFCDSAVLHQIPRI